MRYFSLFSGVGGFEMPLNELGFDCVGQSEIDKYASAVLRYRFPNVPNYGDITKIDWSAVPDFDLLVGGSPCQDLSVAGKGRGLKGERSGLFYEYIRALQEKKPSYFIWENVKGALSSNGGRDFAHILDQMAEAGYSLWWQVLNAKDFGVPQNRERVFVVGSRSRPAREVFFETRADRSDSQLSGDEQQGAQGIATRHLNRNGGLTAPHASSVQAAETPHIVAIDTKQPGPPRFSVASPTLQANGYKEPIKVTDGMRIRRLMPVECERLMSWPDDWTRWGVFDNLEKTEISDSQRYKMAGNGVVSKVVAEVVKAHLL